MIERKQALEALVGPMVDERSPIQLSDHVDGEGEALFAQASRMGLEGIVSKKADARYVQGRTQTWQKVKRVDVGTFAIVGFLSNMPRNVSSLLLAEERDGELVYTCRVGSGISEDKARDLYAILSKSVRPTPVVPVPKTPGVLWVEPVLNAEIGYRSRSVNDSPRAPVLFSVAPRKIGPAAKATKPRLISDRDLAAIHLTNPQREMFADSAASPSWTWRSTTPGSATGCCRSSSAGR